MRPADHRLVRLAASPVATCLIALVLVLLGTACQGHRRYIPKEDTEEWPKCSRLMEELEALVEQGSVEALDLVEQIRATCWDILEDEELTALEIEVAARHGRYVRVIQTIDRYWIVHWTLPDAWRLPLAQARLNVATTLPPEEAAGQIELALQLTGAYVEEEPDDARGHLLHAVALESAGRTDEALVAYGEAIVRAGDDERMREGASAAQAHLEARSGVERAAAQLGRGEVDAALASLEPVLEREPHQPRARGLRAVARASQVGVDCTDAEAVLDDVRAALEGGFESPRVAFLEGYMSDRLGRSSEALVGYRRFLLGGGLTFEPPQNLVFAAERRAILAGLESGMTELACASSVEQLRPLRDRAAGGDVEALVQLGALVERGQPGLVPDVELAAMWYTRAAEHPDTPSAEAAWRLFRVDASLEQLDAWAAIVADDPAAVEAEREEGRARAEAWLARAAELGSPDAGFELALRAEREQPVESLAWALAVSRRAEGDLATRVGALVTRLEELLSVEERAEATRLAALR